MSGPLPDEGRNRRRAARRMGRRAAFGPPHPRRRYRHRADRPDDGPARSRSPDYGRRCGGGLSGPRKRRRVAVGRQGSVRTVSRAGIRAGRTLRPDRLQSALLRRFADLPRRGPHHGASRRAPAFRPIARRGRAPARRRGPLRRDSADGRSPAFCRHLPRIPRADPLYGRTHHATPSGQTPADGICARKRLLRPALRFSSCLLRTGRRHGRTRAVHPRIPGLNP